MSRFALSRRQALAGFSSIVAASPLLRAQQTPPLEGEPPGRIAPHGELINAFEFEQMAKRKLDNEAYSLIVGSDRREFDRMTYRPRLMVDVMELDLTIELFGDSMFAPILVGPASDQKRFHPEGELAMAAGASAAQAAMVVSSRASYPFDEIAAQAKTPLWYQVYPGADEAAVVTKVRQAVKAGCRAICLTVGTPFEPAGSGGYPKLGEIQVQANPALDWEYIDRLRQSIEAPLLLKGVMSADEAGTAVGKGIQGIIVSNHGGRYLTGLVQPMTVLPEIVEAVAGKIPVLIDGSFRRGSDILKALALGARAVLLGRPPLWGLAAYGAAGVQTILEMLQTELAADMAMCGAMNLGAVTRDLVKIHRR